MRKSAIILALGICFFLLQMANRMLLRKVMQEVGLDYIQTEWWHFQLPSSNQYPILNKLL